MNKMSLVFHLLDDVIAESMTSPFWNLHWPQVRSTLPVVFGLSFLLDRVLLLPPISRLDVHRLRFEATSTSHDDVMLLARARMTTSHRRSRLRELSRSKGDRDNLRMRKWTIKSLKFVLRMRIAFLSAHGHIFSRVNWTREKRCRRLDSNPRPLSMDKTLMNIAR